jgi:hypothetical protein
MESTQEAVLPAETDGATTPVLNVLLLYEDTATGLRAKRTLDRLPGHLQAGMSPRLWRVDLLGVPLLREQIAVEAAGCEIVLLSLHGRDALPGTVRVWLDRWLEHKLDRPYALGLLLDPPLTDQDETHPIVAFVRGATAGAGVDLFYGFGEAISAPLPMHKAFPRPLPFFPFGLMRLQRSVGLNALRGLSG